MSELKYETVFQAGVKKGEETRSQELLDLRTKYAEALKVIEKCADGCQSDKARSKGEHYSRTMQVAHQFPAKHESDESEK